MKGAHRPEHHGNHNGAVPDFKPPRDRLVPVRAVACPECGVEPGEPCRTMTGSPTHSAHAARRRRALREGL
jgi:hypothetical protein